MWGGGVRVGGCGWDGNHRQSLILRGSPSSGSPCGHWNSEKAGRGGREGGRKEVSE